MPCAAGAVRLSLFSPVSPMTGEHAYLFALTDRSAAACTLHGYPRVTLAYAKGTLPFVYRSGGGQFVTRRKPSTVTLRSGSRAYFEVAKYRCDTGASHAAIKMFVSHIGTGALTLDLRSLGISDLQYCRRSPGTNQTDPGNYVTVSPIESSAGAAAAAP